MSVELEEKVTRRTQIYRQLGQGLRVFHEHQHPEVDIIAIPGLGTNPEECWTWTAPAKKDVGRARATSNSATAESTEGDAGPPRKFNWIRDQDGLASLFPKSRIMLYDYASAWTGDKKVRATMKSICMWLLDDLRERRRDGTAAGRPIIFIGHSMGGVVIAKTLCMARARREFEAIVTCTVGCAFFGAPFRGSNMAKLALMYSSVFGNEAYESLLSFMRSEKNDTLEEVTHDFMEISNKLVPPIDLFCAYETVPTATSYSERYTPWLLQSKAFKAGTKALLDFGGAAFSAGTYFVERESAVLQGAHDSGLTADHRDLIKFESIASEKFSTVKVALRNMVQMAKTNARKRVMLSGQSLLSQRTIQQVRETLAGVDMRLKFRTKVNQREVNSWLESVPLYQSWLAPAESSKPNCSYLWLRGGGGIGKTTASYAAIQDLSKNQAHDQQLESSHGHGGTLLAYFLCEWTPGCDTAEELLKGLITQIVNQDEALAQHGARWFVSNTRSRGAGDGGVNEDIGASGAKATTTVDNLWRCLQDMLEDPAVNNAHIVINNLHLLESSSSTNALLAKLRGDADSLTGQPQASQRVRWLITSRNERHINQYLTAASVSLVDVENDLKYGAAISESKRQHARDAVSQLRTSKSYGSDLAYYIRNSIDTLSADESWIDVLCILLKDMPEDSSSLSIENWVKEASGLNINKLIDHAWEKVLSDNRAARLELEALLQALTIAYEPPTMADLAVLTKIHDMTRLSALIQLCAPVIELGSAGEDQGKIVFTHEEFSRRLSTIYHGQSGGLDALQRKRYHGLMAIRCFNYIRTSVKSLGSPTRLAKVASKRVRSSTVSVRVNDGDVLEVTNDDDDIDGAGVTTSSSPTTTCPYPIKYLFKHLSEGGPDAAQELCEDDPDFWGQSSSLRSAWLREYQLLTTDLRELDTRGMSALHIAAGIGAKELVSILVRRNSTAALSWKSNDGMTALHTAACNNHTDVVDALIRAGADIEAGEGSSGTALHLAALRGHCEVMALLISQGANINALSQKDGPVINAAILSGAVKAVEKIMEGDVHFDLDYSQYDAPLSLSARILESNLFADILENGRDKWLENAKLLDRALISASYNAPVETVRILLRFPHSYTNNTMEKAILSAAEEKKWHSVHELLDHVISGSKAGRPWNFSVDDAFYLAATTREENLDVLNKLWYFSKQSITPNVRDFSLYQATVMKKDATVLWLLETCGANANATASKPDLVGPATAATVADYATALNAAASRGMTNLVSSLLQKGANLDGESGYALHLAAREGHDKVVQILLDRDAAVDKEVPNSEDIGFFSSTALQAACENNKVEVIKILLARGANPNLGGGASSNPITAATERGLPEVLNLLLQHPRIDVNVTGGSENSTPLINAATHMPMETVKSLIEHGADVNALNARGDSALIMAAQKGEKATVELLCNHGADVTYRSPQRGLPIQVAAESLNALCAWVLAERMADMIETYRQKIIFDTGVANERDTNITILKERIEEAQEALIIANKDAEFAKLEKTQLESMGALQGQTYASVMEQSKSIQAERLELQKQYDASKGQLGLANETINRFKLLLEDERQNNADLRKRQGFVALQEERNNALEMLEQQKKASSYEVELERQKHQQLQSEIASLQRQTQTLQSEVFSVQTAAQAANERAEAIRQEKQTLQDQIVALQEHTNELKEALTAVQTAASKATPAPTPTAEAPKLPERPAPATVDEYFNTDDADAANPTVLDTSSDDAAASAPIPLVSSPLSANDSSPGMSPGQQVTSPRFPGPSGFRTIHGTHRPDGSLGGYRKDASLRRQMSEGVHGSSIRNGLGAGARSLSSSHSRQSLSGGRGSLSREASIEEEQGTVKTNGGMGDWPQQNQARHGVADFQNHARKVSQGEWPQQNQSPARQNGMGDWPKQNQNHARQNSQGDWPQQNNAGWNGVGDWPKQNQTPRARNGDDGRYYRVV
ncbi:Ankyrin repeat domain-containing protein 17 [Cercospora beticola]|uniref:Ankyrin repeat domain-containing protein 17 n=1 Tax=Cercospora beticola TaxID=122368 RepID=A0A2G5I6Y6_CERBT|nr:Ankyrin repeat domain-containing protein 17 [Cercospora beticola]PIB00567.1 Ankyrin repeat domain-containing protein 17 [Cercospora beticola]WPA97493.1 hypothetical protein RHO25_002103 [Cercospora beticola]